MIFKKILSIFLIASFLPLSALADSDNEDLESGTGTRYVVMEEETSPQQMHTRMLQTNRMLTLYREMEASSNCMKWTAGGFACAIIFIILKHFKIHEHILGD